MPVVFRQKNKKYHKDNKPRLTYLNYVPLINSLIVMLKYPILVLEQDGGIFKQKTKKKIIIRKVARIVVPTMLFSPFL